MPALTSWRALDAIELRSAQGVARGTRPRWPRCAPAAAAAPCRRESSVVRLSVHLDRVTDRLPARVAAVHVLRIEARLAQLDGGLATDVKAVRAVHDHRF